MISGDRSVTISIWADSDKPKSFFTDMTHEESEFFDRCRAGSKAAKAKGWTTVYPAELPPFGKIPKVWPKE